MTEKDKQLLLRDLSARLPHNVKVLCSYYDDSDDDEPTQNIFVLNEIDTRDNSHPYWIGGEQLQENGFSNGTTSFAMDIDDDVQFIKPYLRPISSMTYDEKNDMREGLEWVEAFGEMFYDKTPEFYDWLNAHHFDYRHLIEKGLALEASENMYSKEDMPKLKEYYDD